MYVSRAVFCILMVHHFLRTNPYKMLIFESLVTFRFFQELYSHIDRNSGKKSEDMFLVKILNKGTSLTKFKFLSLDTFHVIFFARSRTLSVGNSDAWWLKFFELRKKAVKGQKKLTWKFCTQNLAFKQKLDSPDLRDNDIRVVKSNYKVPKQATHPPLLANQCITGKRKTKLSYFFSSFLPHLRNMRLFTLCGHLFEQLFWLLIELKTAQNHWFFLIIVTFTYEKWSCVMIKWQKTDTVPIKLIYPVLTFRFLFRMRSLQ